MAITTIKVYSNYAPVLQWLQDNVGPSLHYKPIIFWHGEGWHLTIGHDPAPKGQLSTKYTVGKNYCVVDFDDEQKAIWFKLVWG